MEISDEAYKKLVLEVAASRQGVAEPRKRFSLGNLLFTLACLIPVALLVARIGPEVAVMYGVKVPFVGTPQTTFSTRQETPGGAQGVRPSPLPRYTPFYGTAPEVSNAAEPTATATPAPPSPTAFWNATEVAAFTATAEAFFDPSTLPTAEPAFVEYAAKACQDPEQVAESATLRLFCGK